MDNLGSTQSRSCCDFVYSHVLRVGDDDFAIAHTTLLHGGHMPVVIVVPLLQTLIAALRLVFWAALACATVLDKAVQVATLVPSLQALIAAL